jgi:type II secretory pathway predicted ATPase ExeA
VVAYLTVPPGGVTDLLADAAADLGLPAEDLPPDQLASGVRGHLSTLRQAGKRAYLVVDDVHNLSAGGLRDLQSLLVARYGSRFLLPGLLLGEPGFRETLRDSEYRPLRHATSVAYQLNPLGLEETMAYVEHRLRVAGWQGDPRWLPLAHMEVYFLSFGIPGRVDQLCERVLAHAAELGLHEIKAETVSTAAALLPPEPEPVLESPW